MEALGSPFLFSGCAVEHDRRPVRSATLALANTLHLALTEVPSMVCCGARLEWGASEPDARHLLSPVLAAALQGRQIVCLSSACQCALTPQLLELARCERVAPAEMLRLPLQVQDYVEALARPGVLMDRLTHSRARRSALQVALHGICHADHNPAHWPSGSVVSVEFSQGGSFSFTRKNTSEADSALATLVAASGATVLEDVSSTCQSAKTFLPGGQLGTHKGAGETLPCLAEAARAGANVVVTPCVLCYSDLNRYQRMLSRGDPARSMPVLHLAQFLGMVSAVAAEHLGLGQTAVPARQLLKPLDERRRPEQRMSPTAM